MSNKNHSIKAFGKLSGALAKTGCGLLLAVFISIVWVTQTHVIPPIPLSIISPTAVPDPKVVLRESIDQALGADNMNLPRLIKIAYSVPEAGDITISWAVNRIAFQNATKTDVQLDAANILKALETNKTRFIYVVLIGTALIQDKEGNTIEVQALNLGFNKSKLDKVDWVNFQPSDVYDLADVAYIADEWK